MASGMMMPHARCSRCEKRRTLARHPGEYMRVPRCSRCGSARWRIDKYRRDVERNKKRTPVCNPGRGGCSAYHFPHRKGSGFCIHNPNVTEAMLREREGCSVGLDCPF